MFSGTLFLLLAACTAATPALETGEKSDQKPPQETVPFGEDFFPIVPWDRIPSASDSADDPANELAAIAECNFTVAGFVRPEHLAECEKLGLAAVMAGPGGWAKMSDQEIDAAVKKMVDETGPSKAVLGYYLRDEPGVSAFAALGKAVAAVKKHAPGKLAYINLFPGYATVGAPDTSQLGTANFTEYLERYVEEVAPEFISYDNYMVQFSDDLQVTANAAKYYSDLLEVRRISEKHRLPFWNIVSSNQIRKTTPVPSPANLAFQAYTTLAAGGRSVAWYKYRYHRGYAYSPIDKTGRKTDTWHYLRTVNHQVKTLGPILNRLRSTGVYFSSGTLGDLLPPLPGAVVREVQSVSSLRVATAARPPVMVGEFVDPDGTAYVMIVNLSLEKSTNIKFKTAAEYKNKEVISATDGLSSPLDEENGLWLVPGHGALIKLDSNATK